MRRNETAQLVASGSAICSTIKRVMHGDEKWDARLSRLIAREFSICKAECRKYKTDFDDTALHSWMASLPDEDYREMILEMKK